VVVSIGGRKRTRRDSLSKCMYRLMPFSTHLCFHWKVPLKEFLAKKSCGNCAIFEALLRVSERSIGYVVFYFHFRGWQICVETLFDCGAYRVQCTPYVTHQQSECHPQRTLYPSNVRQLITHSPILSILVIALPPAFALASSGSMPLHFFRCILGRALAVGTCVLSVI
jgi:hypothetical protein